MLTLSEEAWGVAALEKLVLMKKITGCEVLFYLISTPQSFNIVIQQDTDCNTVTYL